MQPKKIKNQTKTKNQRKAPKKSSKKPQKKNAKKLVEKRRLMKCPLVLVGVASFCLVIMILGVYLLGWNNLLVRTMAKVVPFPVATIGSFHWVSFNDYCERVEIIRHYHNLQGAVSGFENYDLDSEAGYRHFEVAKKNLLDRMIKDEVIKTLAKKHNVSVEPEDIQIEMKRIADANGGTERMAEEIERIYQLSLKDFSRKIIKNKIYQRKLYQLVFEQGELDREAGEFTFSEWVVEKTKELRICIPLRQYFWSTEDAEVYFLDEEMNRYEKSIIQQDY